MRRAHLILATVIAPAAMAMAMAMAIPPVLSVNFVDRSPNSPTERAEVAEGAEAAQAAPERLLIYSVPGLTWADTVAPDLPAINGFLADAAVANLAPRSVVSRSRPGEAYLTISAGTRAASDRSVDGQVLALDEGDPRSPAGEIFTRRTGVSPDGGYVALGWPELVRANENQPYDAVPGLLGDTLDREGVGTAVIANADGTDSVGASYERQAGLALVGTDGVLEGGSLGSDLLTTDPVHPFGVRLDHDAVFDAFRTAWAAAADGRRQVVLVEASDLARTLRYRPFVDADRYRELFEAARLDADRLFARLMAEVDLERDAVLVVSPYLRAGLTALSVVGLHTPNSAPGYLRSASTQRTGIVTLVDIAPTVLDVLGIARPVEMEGRRVDASTSDASLSERRSELISMNEASRFRRRLLAPTTVALVLVIAVVAALAVAVLVGEWSRRARAIVRFAALTAMAALPMSYVARGFPLEDWGVGFYWPFLIGSSAAVAAVATIACRRTGWRYAGLAGVLALVLGVLVGDVMTGSNLHLGAAFGYSPTGNSRLYGISNYSYGQVAAATSLLAAIIVGAWPDRRGQIAGIGLMTVVLIVLGVPTWGSDVGGVLAFTPTILVFVALVRRWRIRIRSVLIGAVVTVAAVVAFGLADLARPAGERAHLGRLFERIGNEGVDPLLSIVERKLLANLEVSTSSFWVAVIPIGVAFWLFLWRFPATVPGYVGIPNGPTNPGGSHEGKTARPLARIGARLPTLTAGLVAALVAAALGSVLNDSGAIVGGVTLLVVTASLGYLAMEPE